MDNRYDPDGKTVNARRRDAGIEEVDETLDRAKTLERRLVSLLMTSEVGVNYTTADNLAKRMLGVASRIGWKVRIEEIR